MTNSTKIIEVKLNNVAELKQYWLCTGTAVGYQDVKTYDFQEIATAFNSYNTITMVIEGDTYQISKTAGLAVKLMAYTALATTFGGVGYALATFLTGG